MKPKQKKTIYYNDEAKDDFSNVQIKKRKQINVNQSYNYLPKSRAFKFASFVFYFLFATPLLIVANFLFFKTKTKGRKNLRKLKGKGYFVYANHTHYRDAWLTPISIARFKKSYVIAEKSAFEIPIARGLVKIGGGLPVPDTPLGLKNLAKSIATIIENKQIVTIFPEAHIWPYFTGIRPFPLTSFRFAANTNAPAVPVAVCYKKKKLFGNYRKPKQVVFIGEPVFAKSHFSNRENAEFLRKECYSFIKATTKRESTYSYVDYVKAPEKIKQDEVLKNEKEAVI